MAITKKPKRNKAVAKDAAADAFINAAPDGSGSAETATPPRKGVRKGKRLQISLTIAPELLEEVDAKAAEAGISRAAIINIAIRRGMKSDLIGE